MKPINLDALMATVTKTVGTSASAVAAINGIAALIGAAVMKALEEDDAADQGTNDAVQAAIDAEVANLTASEDQLAAAILANSGGPGPSDPMGGTGRGSGAPTGSGRQTRS